MQHSVIDDPVAAVSSLDANPLMVEVIRGDVVESWHRGSAAVVDAGGTLRAAWGEVDRPIYPRSAMKALQALALVESGAAEALALGDQQIALACASHNGDPAHVAGARAMLENLGLDETDLECGAQWPSLEQDAHALVRAGETPGPLHNNCSGKHAGMLTLAHHLGTRTAGYTDPAHPVQRRIQAILEAMCDHPLTDVAPGVDGCSAPNWPIPLRNLARAFARVADPAGLAPQRMRAIERIRDAVFAHPFMVAGSGRFCTGVMEILGRGAFIKTGAEGVFCAALPGSGLGIALKCDDGAGRASQVMMAALLRQLGVVNDEHLEAMQPWLSPEIRNRNRRAVGHVRCVMTPARGS